MAKKSNRWRPRETYDNYHAAFDMGDRIEIFCDTETGGISSFRKSGPEYEKALADILAEKSEDAIFLDDEPEATAEDERLASAVAGDDLLQLSAIKYRVKDGVRTEIDRMNMFILNRKPIDPGASKVNHITEESLAEVGAKSERDSFPEIKKFFSGADVFVAYNEPFDYGMLKALYVRQGEEFNPPHRFDVMAMAIDCISMYKCESKKLGKIAEYLKVVTGDEVFHDSLEDIKVTVKVFEALIPQFEALPAPVDTRKFRTPRINRYWVWQSPQQHKMIRIYFLTDCGKLFMEKLDRSFGTDGQYGIDELNMEGFLKNVLNYFKVERLEDIVHLKLG